MTDEELNELVKLGQGELLRQLGASIIMRMREDIVHDSEQAVDLLSKMPVDKMFQG